MVLFYSQDIILLFRAFDQHIFYYYTIVIIQKHNMRISYYSTTTIIYNVRAILMFFFFNAIRLYTVNLFSLKLNETKFIKK